MNVSSHDTICISTRVHQIQSEQVSAKQHAAEMISPFLWPGASPCIITQQLAAHRRQRHTGARVECRCLPVVLGRAGIHSRPPAVTTLTCRTTNVGIA
jgi:hypothetical protein